MRKNRLLILTLIITLTALSLTGCSNSRGQKTAEDEVVTYEAVPVVLDGVTSGEVYNSIYTIGEVKSSEQYQANAMTSGDVVEIFFNVGDSVEEGQVLFTIETTDFEVEKSTNLTKSSNAVTQAKITYDNAKENYDKYQTLFASGAASQAELDKMKTNYDNAKIGYNNSLQSYESAKHSYDSKGDNYAVTAPSSGIITAKNLAEGMFASNKNGFTIDVTDQYIVESQVASKYINDVSVGQEVELYVSTLDQKVLGTVDSISLSATNGSYPIEIKVNEGNETLKPGMYADIWVIKDKSPDGLWIPSQALLQENGMSFVYTVDNDVAKKVTVEVMSMRGEETAVKSTLTKDSQLITFGKEYVMDGAPVEVTAK